MGSRIIGITGIVVLYAACGSSRSTATNGASDGASDAASAADAGNAPAAPYTLGVLDAARITSKPDDPSYQKVRADVEPTGAPFAGVKLIVDLASTCFPFDQWKKEPPPAGQNWPASCDAFDRNFEVVLFDPAAADAPGIELAHAITPFGGPLHLELDVTDVFNAVRGKRRLEVTVTTNADAAGKVSGSNGGWNVSAHLDFVPGAPPRNVLAVLPLLYGPITTGGAEQTFHFTVPPGTASARVEYLATGHGGAKAADCIGPADEFCQRVHTLTADGAPVVAKKTIWRDDCDKLCTLVKGGPFGQYCQENPCGAPQSVQAPRANWCPGSITTPMVLEPPAFATPGDHTFGFTIDKIADGASWRVSAKVFAYGSE